MRESQRLSNYRALYSVKLLVWNPFCLD